MQFKQNKLRGAVKLFGGGDCWWAVCVIEVTVLPSLELNGPVPPGKLTQPILDLLKSDPTKASNHIRS